MAAANSSRAGADHVREITSPALFKLPFTPPQSEEAGKNRKPPMATEASAHEGTLARLEVKLSGSIAVITGLTPVRIAQMRGIRVTANIRPGDPPAFYQFCKPSTGNQKTHTTRQPPANPATTPPSY